MVFAEPNIQISGKPRTHSVEIGKTVVVDVSIINREVKGHMITDLDVQLVHPGFKTLTEKSWPTTLSSTHGVKGVYLLEATEEGTHSLEVLITYKNDNGGILSYYNKTENIGNIEVKRNLSDALAHYTSDPISATIIGALGGGGVTAGATKGIGWILREKSSKERIKELFSSEILDNKARVENGLPSRSRILDVIKAERRYKKLESKKDLFEAVNEYYQKLDTFDNRSGEDRKIAGNKEEVLKAIGELDKKLKGWE